MGFGRKTKHLGLNPRALGTNPKALGKNPRALGLNARNLRVNPKQLGVNPRAVADLSVEEREALIAAIQTRNADSGYSRILEPLKEV